MNQKFKVAAPQPKPAYEEEVAQDVVLVQTDEPIQIDRYLIEEKIGEGRFGVVYLAFDLQLERQVALKVQQQDTIKRTFEVCSFEARILASLRHPNIVGVFDANETESGDFYIASELIDGLPLSEHLKTGPLAIERAVEIAAAMAAALAHAHQRDIVHRDVKPSNIMVDVNGNAVLIDFGVAIGEENYGQRWLRAAGTPEYMSPEQLSGEGHRIDGRSDIFSLGLVLFEMLTATRIQAGGEGEEQRLSWPSKTPREIISAIPAQLEYICLRAIEKKRKDRYQTAEEFEDQLREFAQSSLNSTELSLGPPVVPKGVQSFSESDSKFFLSLLPGPRDAKGIPDSVRYWRDKIQEPDPRKCFHVGLIYGESGVGKSSFIRAGVLPQLASSVAYLPVTANAEHPADLLREALAGQDPYASAAQTAVEAAQLIRTSPARKKSQKILVVIDQLERAFFAPESERTDLIEALRQCDGHRLQAILLVRDEYWSETTKFASALETTFEHDTNLMFLERFNRSHTQSVLKQIGNAYHPTSKNETSYKKFIDCASVALAGDDGAIPIQLSLFFEVFRARSWEWDQLRKIGSLSGIARTFLEDTFESDRAPKRISQHAEAAAKALHSLVSKSHAKLATTTTTIAELRRESEYDTASKRFDELLHLLEYELRLISATSDQNGNVVYQITHDYLVAPIQKWAEHRLYDSAAGRAKLKLIDATKKWRDSGRKQSIPNFRDWIQIQLYWSAKYWSDTQRKMMRVANIAHCLKIVAVILSALFVSLAIRSITIHQSNKQLAQQLLQSSTTEFPNLITEVGQRRPGIDKHFEATWNAPAAPEAKKLRAGLAMIGNKPERDLELAEHLLQASPNDIEISLSIIDKIPDHVKAYLKSIVNDPDTLDQQKVRAGILIGSTNSDTILSDSIENTMASYIVSKYSTENWSNCTKSLEQQLRPHYQHLFRSNENIEAIGAAAILAITHQNEPEKLLQLLLTARTEQLNAILNVLVNSAGAEACIRNKMPTEKGERRAKLAVALFKLGADDATSWFGDHSSPDTSVPFSQMLPNAGVPFGQVYSALASSTIPSERYFLILSIAGYQLDSISDYERQSALKLLHSIYSTDRDLGVHSAARWAIRTAFNDSEPFPQKRDYEPTFWFECPSGMTMAMYELGKGSSLHRFAISTTELTYDSVPESVGILQPSDTEGAERSPIRKINLQKAFRICNALSDEFKFERCFESKFLKGKSILYPKKDYLKLNGFRPPTTEEWEHAFNQSDDSSYLQNGASELRLQKYAWFNLNSQMTIHEVAQLRPNREGLFDMLGNTREMCFDFESMKDGSLTSFSTRGGACDAYRSGIQDLNPFLHFHEHENHTVGIRVVRSLPLIK